MAVSAGTVDINLTALISSVERDIWLLEQLESNSSDRRRNFPTDDLPFPITEEILKLPGYKPKISQQQQDKHEHHSQPDLPVHQQNPLGHQPARSDHHDRKPILPPKLKNENSPKIGDLIHQRLLPRDNCVTNILYSRRLPSPPVYRRPVASSTHHQHFSQDDHFREQKFSEEDGEETHNLFCPLCALKFGYSFGLECHLLSVHRDDLRNESNARISSNLERCPKCRAQFVGEGILVKHLISSHKDFVVRCIMLEGENTMLKRYLECRFCGQHFMRRHLKLFTIHMEQKHESELQQYLHREATKFSPSDVFGIEEEDSPSIEIALTLTLLRTVSFPTTQTSVIINDLDNEGKKKKTQVNQTQTLASSLRRKRSSSQPATASQPATRTLPRMPSASKQSLEADLQFIPGDPNVSEITLKPRQLSIRFKKASPVEQSNPNPVNNNPHQVQENLLLNHASHDDVIPLPAKSKMAQQQQRRLMLSTYRHVPQPEPPPSALPAMLGLLDHMGSTCVEDEADPRAAISCYASSSSESSHSNSNSIDLDPLWTSVLRKHPQDPNLFRCNLCEMSFAENAFLLTHLKNNHRSNMSKALRPQFSCGACPAKFFKNSFLVKHCQFHLNSDKRRQ